MQLSGFYSYFYEATYVNYANMEGFAEPVINFIIKSWPHSSKFIHQSKSQSLINSSIKHLCYSYVCIYPHSLDQIQRKKTGSKTKYILICEYKMNCYVI